MLERKRDEFAEKARDRARMIDDNNERITLGKAGVNNLVGNTSEVKTEFDWFNFAKNEALNVEHIIRSCFLNPDRSKFPNAIKYFDLCNDDKNLEYFLHRISSELPSSLKKFNNSEMSLYNTHDFWPKTFKREPIDPFEFFD